MLSDAELQALAAPIALYPDDVVAAIFTAANRPADVEEAARYAATDNPSWNPSVRALLPYPEILQRMAENPEWTSDIGRAASAQRSGLMQAVQVLRQYAQAAGQLRSDEQHIVRYYDPLLVYGAWRPAHRVVRWRPWQARTVPSAQTHTHSRLREPPRNGPPSQAQQMQDKMPGAQRAPGNGEPSPARQMQLRQNAGSAEYEPVPESKRQPIIHNEPRRPRAPEPR
jgi:hypothetical protein